MPIPVQDNRAISELLSLEGRVAIVTGGGRGIGRGIVRRLAEAGASVVITDIDGVAAQTAASEVVADGARAIGVQLDVSDPDAVAELPERIKTEFGRIDILVNNAGIFPIVPALTMTHDVWGRVIGVNLSGAFLCSQAIGQVLADQGGGVIINICSTQSLKAASPGVTAYTASKFGLAGLTQALALELGPAGIRVLGVAPTIVESPGFQALQPQFDAAGLGDVVTPMAAALPLGRVATADDVARVVLFAASDMAAIMTGSLILADAGSLCV